MAKPPRKARYLWGITKVQYLQFSPTTGRGADGERAGMMYFDSGNNTFRFCEDGTHFMLIRESLHN